MHCVDLGGSFPTSIYLQKSASIQPRTSPSKFGEKFNSLFTSLVSLGDRVRLSLWLLHRYSQEQTVQGWGFVYLPAPESQQLRKRLLEVRQSDDRLPGFPTHNEVHAEPARKFPSRSTLMGRVVKIKLYLCYPFFETDRYARTRLPNRTILSPFFSFSLFSPLVLCLSNTSPYTGPGCATQLSHHNPGRHF